VLKKIVILNSSSKFPVLALLYFEVEVKESEFWKVI